MQKIETKNLALKIAKILDERLALDILVLDISELTTICDYFVIASGRSDVQVRAMCDELDQNIELKSYRIWHKEGYRKGRWIVLDFNDVVVHLFHKDEREFYNLERLWADGVRLEIDKQE